MEIRDVTKAKYIKFLTDIAYMTNSFDMMELSRTNKIDIKLFGLLKSKELIIHTKEKNKFIANFKVGQIEDIISEFIDYRSKLQNEYDEEIRDLKYYRENKEFLVDKRNLTAFKLGSQRENEIKKEVIKEYSREIIQYVEMAIKYGKKDIEKYVLTLIDID